LDYRQTGFTFNSFIEHLTPLTILAWVATLGYMRYYYRADNTKIAFFHPKDTGGVLLEIVEVQ